MNHKGSKNITEVTNSKLRFFKLVCMGCGNTNFATSEDPKFSENVFSCSNCETMCVRCVEEPCQ